VRCARNSDRVERTTPCRLGCQNGGERAGAVFDDRLLDTRAAVCTAPVLAGLVSEVSTLEMRLGGSDLAVDQPDTEMSPGACFQSEVDACLAKRDDLVGAALRFDIFSSPGTDVSSESSVVSLLAHGDSAAIGCAVDIKPVALIPPSSTISSLGTSTLHKSVSPTVCRRSRWRAGCRSLFVANSNSLVVSPKCGPLMPTPLVKKPNVEDEQAFGEECLEVLPDAEELAKSSGEQDNEEMENLPPDIVANDWLFRAKVICQSHGVSYHGVVEGIERGLRSREILYRIRCNDGDTEHVSKTEAIQSQAAWMAQNLSATQPLLSASATR